MQNLLSRQSQKGLTFTGVLMIVFVVVLGWLCVNWAVGYFGSTKAQKIMTESLLKNKGMTNDEELKAAILEDLKTNGPIIVDAEALKIFRAQDGSQAKIQLRYEYPVVVPFTTWQFKIPFNIDFEEKLNRARVF